MGYDTLMSFRVDKSISRLTKCVLRQFSRSREEIEVWKEKQGQVKAEKARLLANTDITSSPSSPKEQLSPCVTTTNESNNWMKYKTRITRIERRDMWIKIAEIFIKQV